LARTADHGWAVPDKPDPKRRKEKEEVKMQPTEEIKNSDVAT